MLTATAAPADTSTMIETDPTEQHQIAVATMLSDLDDAYHTAVRERDAKAAEAAEAAEAAYTAIDRVRRLHRQNRYNRCTGCANSYPCATIVALDNINGAQAYDMRRNNAEYVAPTFRPLTPVEQHAAAVTKMLSDLDTTYHALAADKAARRGDLPESFTAAVDAYFG